MCLWSTAGMYYSPSDMRHTYRPGMHLQYSDTEPPRVSYMPSLAHNGTSAAGWVSVNGAAVSRAPPRNNLQQLKACCPVPPCTYPGTASPSVHVPAGDGGHTGMFLHCPPSNQVGMHLQVNQGQQRSLLLMLTSLAGGWHHMGGFGVLLFGLRLRTRHATVCCAVVLPCCPASCLSGARDTRDRGRGQYAFSGYLTPTALDAISSPQSHHQARLDQVLSTCPMGRLHAAGCWLQAAKLQFKPAPTCLETQVACHQRLIEGDPSLDKVAQVAEYGISIVHKVIGHPAAVEAAILILQQQYVQVCQCLGPVIMPGTTPLVVFKDQVRYKMMREAYKSVG